MPWNNTIITQLIIQGSNAGIFIYSPAPALGNLIGSWTAQAGVDQYGNLYPKGLSVTTAASIANATILTATINNAIIQASAMQQGTIFESAITFDTGGGSLLMYTTTTTTVTFNTPGTPTWTAPASGVATADIRVWGAGASGGGGSSSRGGEAGGGSEYTEVTAYTITPAGVYNLLVGLPDTGAVLGQTGAAGGNSQFDTALLSGPGVKASGGLAGANFSGGQGGFGSGQPIDYVGGNGANSPGTATAGSGGGSSGSPSGPGNNGHSASGGIPGAGGTKAGGGSGGAGGASGSPGVAGLTPGGGGGGNGRNGPLSGAGGNGQIQLIYFAAGTQILEGALSPVAGADALGSTFGAGWTGPSQAFHPGSNPALVETWQNVTPPAGWTGTLRYRLLSEMNEVFLDYALSHTALAAKTNIQLINTLPASPNYRPATSATIQCEQTNNTAVAASSPSTFIGTGGLVTAFNVDTGTTRIDCHQSYRLD